MLFVSPWSIILLVFVEFILFLGNWFKLSITLLLSFCNLDGVMRLYFYVYVLVFVQYRALRCTMSVSQNLNNY